MVSHSLPDTAKFLCMTYQVGPSVICPLLPYLAPSFSIPPKHFTLQHFSINPELCHILASSQNALVLPFHMAKRSSVFQILPEMCLFQDVFLIPSWLWAPSGHSLVCVFHVSPSICSAANGHFTSALKLPGCYLFKVGRTAWY